MKLPFYKRAWFIILLLVFLAPVGIIVMWWQAPWTRGAKIALTLIVASWYVMYYAFCRPNIPSVSTSASAAAAQTLDSGFSTPGGNIAEELYARV